MRISIAAAVLAAVACSPAAAQEARFPGARVDVHAGWDHANIKAGYSDSANPANNESVSANTDGIVFGGTAGYDIRVANGTYIGVEAGVDFADNTRCEEIFGGDEFCFSAKRNLFVGGRFGTRLAQRTMFYAGAGYVNGKGRASYADPADPTSDFDEADTLDGWRLTGGFEQQITGYFFAKAEARYHNFDDFEYVEGTEKYSLGLTRKQVVIGLGSRF